MKIVKSLYILLSCFMLILLINFFSCNNKKNERQNNSLTNKNLVEYKLFKTEKGWGYDIFVNNKKYIHQPVIPSVVGLKSFSTKEKAQKTAKFVCSKIKRNIMPPSVKPAELDSLEVLNN